MTEAPERIIASDLNDFREWEPTSIDDETEGMDDTAYVLASTACRHKRQRDKLLEAMKGMIAALQSELPENCVGEGDWLDTMPGMDEPVSAALAAIAECDGEA